MEVDKRLYSELIKENVNDMENIGNILYSKEDLLRVYDFIKRSDDKFFNRVLYYNYINYFNKNDEYKKILETTDEKVMKVYFDTHENFALYFIINYYQMCKLKYNDETKDKFNSEKSLVDSVVSYSKDSKIDKYLKEAVYHVYNNAINHGENEYTSFVAVKELILHNNDIFASLPKIGSNIDEFGKYKVELSRLLYRECFKALNNMPITVNNEYFDLKNYIDNAIDSGLSNNLPDKDYFVWQMISIFIHSLKEEENKIKKNNFGLKKINSLYFVEN